MTKKKKTDEKGIRRIWTMLKVQMQVQDQDQVLILIVNAKGPLQLDF